ncbi:MAG: hypothetical protein Q9204_007217 [Flavoplaca sp. TL-2023a]
MSSPSRSPRPSPPPCPPPPPPSPQSPHPPMPLSPRSQARHAAAIISAIVPLVRHSRREIPNSEDDSEDPNASLPNAAPAQPPAMPLRTTTQQHRHLGSLPTYLHHRALRHHNEADLEAAARTAESNASEGCDAMEMCEEVGSAAPRITTTTVAATNASAVGTTGAENERSNASAAAESSASWISIGGTGGLVLPRITIPPRRRRRDGRQFEIFDEEAVWEEEAEREDREGWWGLRIG